MLFENVFRDRVDCSQHTNMATFDVEIGFEMEMDKP
jgi:hypothetical protein